MTSTSNTWLPLTTVSNTNIDQTISICNFTPSIMLYTYSSTVNSHIYISNDSGNNWKDILTNLPSEYSRPGISFSAIGYDTINNVYRITSAITSQIKTTFTAYINYATCPYGSDVTDSTKWTWYSADTYDSASPVVYGAMSSNGTIFYMSNVDAYKTNSYITYYDISSNPITKIKLIDNSSSSLLYYGIACTFDGYYVTYYGDSVLDGVVKRYKNV